MVRVVVFDFDGTLVDSNGVKEDCLRRVIAEHRGGDAALIAARKGGGDRYRIFVEVAQQLSMGADAENIVFQARQMAAAYTLCCAKGIVAATERRGARGALAALARRGLRLWVLSATPDRHLVDVLRSRRLLCWFKGCLGSSVSKEEGLRRIIAAERVDRREMLLVGDGIDDQRAARAMGVKFAAVVAERRLDVRGRFSLHDLRPLVPLVDSLNGTRKAQA